MGRPHTLDRNPEIVDELAQMLAEGVPRKDIMSALGISHDTLRLWAKRDDVLRAWTAIIRERSARVRSKVDTRMLKILENEQELSKLTVRQLLDIRDSFSADVPEDDGAGGTEVLTKLMAEAAKDPVLARALKGALSDDGA